MYVNITGSFGCILRRFNNPKFYVYEKRCAVQFGFGWSAYRADLIFLGWFRAENVVFMMYKFRLTILSADNILL